MFLNQILKALPENETENSHYILYRYVDDIIVFYDPTVDGNKLYNKIYNLLVNSGLEINAEKVNCMVKLPHYQKKTKGNFTEREIQLYVPRLRF